MHAILDLPLAPEARRHVFSDAGAAAPDHLNAEALHAIRAHERRGSIQSERAAQALEDLRDLPITRYPTLAVIGRAFELRHNFSAYDALYVALAEELAASLVTADERLARAVGDHTAVEPMLLTIR